MPQTVWEVQPNGEFGETIIPDPPMTPAPAYVPAPIEIPDNPFMLPPDPDQHLGAGGTPFSDSSGASKPVLYGDPYILPRPPILINDPFGSSDPLGYGVPASTGDSPVAPAPSQASRPGDKATMPVPTAFPITKVPVPPVVTSVQAPGPITGTVAGFDLARVPLWGWLVGAFVAFKLVTR